MEVKIISTENRETITPNMLNYVLDLLVQYETQIHLLKELTEKKE